MKITEVIIISLLLASSLSAAAQEADSIAQPQDLTQVVVTASKGARMNRVTNTELIGQAQLVRAACCNLGESFTTNPSVDVSYSDAATGAKQIKLLGLSGTYVQMLTENVPNLRGAAIPYCLGYIPGPWMSAIQVSKGASSVKNGYESVTGQINIEFLKPQATDGVRGNVYYDTEMKLEANADASIHLTDRLSTSILLHYENRQREDDMNHDGFMDMPKIRQYDVMSRWAYVSPRFISQLFVKALRDERISGQAPPHPSPQGRESHTDGSLPLEGGAGGGLYLISVKADRYELQWKNAVITNPEKNGSVALMLHGSLHDQENVFGDRRYDIKQKNGYAQLMYETDITERHNLSVGASLNYDKTPPQSSPQGKGAEKYSPAIDKTNYQTPSPVGEGWGGVETTTGLYTQYTYKLNELLTVMAGLRWDNSSLYGSFLTPRLHVKYSPAEWLSVRASAGKGYRTPHALAENIPLLASSRSVFVEPNLKQEEAWNYGASLNFNIPLFDKNLELNAEYFYTDFQQQMVVNVRPDEIRFENLDGRSFSHTVQIDATYPFFHGFTATAAWRFNDARTTYDGHLRWRPLTSRYKGLLTMSYKTPLELWQFDLTGQLIGPSELYDGSRTPSYGLLQAQITREFRHFSVYLGGENLTNYKQKNPILGASDPWGTAFDATQVYAPTTGAMGYIGIRFAIDN